MTREDVPFRGLMRALDDALHRTRDLGASLVALGVVPAERLPALRRAADQTDQAPRDPRAYGPEDTWSDLPRTGVRDELPTRRPGEARPVEPPSLYGAAGGLPPLPGPAPDVAEPVEPVPEWADRTLTAGYDRGSLLEGELSLDDVRAAVQAARAEAADEPAVPWSTPSSATPIGAVGDDELMTGSEPTRPSRPAEPRDPTVLDGDTLHPGSRARGRSPGWGRE